MGTSPYSPKDLRISAMEEVPGGLGRKTRLTHERSTRGVNPQGQQFRVEDSWDTPTRSMLPVTPCTGRATFLVDKAAHLTESHQMRDEEAYSTKPWWTKLSEFDKLN